MIYAISPSGTVHSFPTAHWLLRKPNYAELKTSQNGTFVAKVPSSWLVSFKNPNNSESSNYLTIRAAVLILADKANLRQLSGWSDGQYLMRIKDALRDFDGRGRRWSR